MVYGLQAQLAMSSAARRDAVLNDIIAWIEGKNRFGAVTVVASPVKAGNNGISVDLRFTTKADATGLLDRVQAFATGARAPLAGSRIVVHDCSHDEESNSCTVTATRTF